MPSWLLSVGLMALVSLALTLATAELALAVANFLRNRDYRRFEDLSEAEIAQSIPMPPVKDLPAEALYRAMSDWARGIYAKANAAQTRYHNVVVRSAACLALAFAALAISTLPVDTHWPPRFRPGWFDPQMLLSLIEVVGLALVLIDFVIGQRIHAPWLTRRAASELMRQQQFLALLFPDGAPGETTEGMLAAFQAEEERIERLVAAVPVREVEKAVTDVWSIRRRAIATRPPGERDLAPDALGVYLRRRARRQLGWFLDSKARLESMAEKRAWVLAVLYFATFGCAALRLFSGHGEALIPELLLIALLVLTGVSGATTAYYFNQNARSLIHRYNTQQRTIRRWLESFREAWPFETISAAPPPAAAKPDLVARILAFEDLMIEELIDWTHITSHDTIELAP